MRLCHNCHKWNTDWPLRCRYCAAGLDGRLCPRNHVNPTDRQVAFCGECGGALERRSGAGFSLGPYLIALRVGLATVLFSGLALLLSQEAPMIAMLISLAILLFGFRFALGILPPSANNFIASVVKGAADILFSILFRTGHKGRT